MGNEKLELELRFDEGKIICNAEEFKNALVSEMKKYDYIVNDANYDMAKKDRANINKIVDIVSTKRKEFSKMINEQWTPYEKLLKECEKLVKEYGVRLGEGINSVDDKFKETRKQEILEEYQQYQISSYVDLNTIFKKEWLNKTTSRKKVSEELNESVDHILQGMQMVKLFLPKDEGDAQQIKEFYFKTLDLTAAKAKADELNAIREKVLAKAQMESAQPKYEEKEAEEEAETNVVEPISRQVGLIRYKLVLTGSRDFFNYMNIGIAQYGAELEILEKEELKNGNTE